MPLQKQINLYVAPGVAGDKATPDQSVYTPLNPLAEAALPVGGFVFPVIEDGVRDNSRATNVAGTATEVLGLVERVINYVNYECFRREPSWSPKVRRSPWPCAAITGPCLPPPPQSARPCLPPPRTAA